MYINKNIVTKKNAISVQFIWRNSVTKSGHTPCWNRGGCEDWRT